jgi:Protein of unknown function (DUF2690)
MLTLKFRKTVAAPAAALFIATAAVAVPGAASAAQAAPAGPAAPSASAGPCWGHSCIGKSPYVGSTSQRDCVKGIANPYQGGYVDASYDVATFPAGDGSVTLRYSPLCAANWARWNGPQKGTSKTIYWVVTSDNNASEQDDSDNLPNYTSMVDGTLLAKVCWSDNVSYITDCSGWY